MIINIIKSEAILSTKLFLELFNIHIFIIIQNLKTLIKIIKNYSKNSH